MLDPAPPVTRLVPDPPRRTEFEPVLPNKVVLGTGASALIGGSGSTEEFADGSSRVVLIAGAGADTIYGVTGSGTQSVFTGSGATFAGLNGAADSVVGGTPAAAW